VWDFLAFPQRGRTSGFDPAVDDRTEGQQTIFRSGLGKINFWYAEPYVTTLLLDGPMPEGSTNTKDYSCRGWCIFERTLSAVSKDAHCYLRLSQMTSRTDYWPGLRAECVARRPAPMVPPAFEQLILQGIAAGEIAFTNGKDAKGIVVPQYEQGFARLLKEAVHLDYANLEWGDAEAKQLADALSYAHRQTPPGLQHVTRLDLMHNKIGDEGLLSLAAVIREGAMPTITLKGLRLNFNPAGKKAQKEVRDALKNRPKR